jgi:hypothetical protein
MIELVTSKDILDIWTKLQEVMERTKRQTKQIHELQSKLKIEEKE